MRGRWIAGLLLAAGALTPVLADAELVLKDGTVLRGAEVRLEAGFYLLELGSGEIVAVPAGVVRELRLLDPRLTEEGATIRRPSDITAGGIKPEVAGEKPGQPTGWKVGDSRDLAGTKWTLNDSKAQTDAIGRPSRFQPSPLNFRFEPQHAWDRKKNVLSRSRSTWQEPIVETIWRPESAFDPANDVLASSRSTWPARPVAAEWNPSNSFSRIRADLWWGKDPIPEPEPPARGTRARLDWDGLTQECGWCAGVTVRPSTFGEPTEEPLEPEECAMRLFADVHDIDTLAWSEIEPTVWDTLPPGLHHAWTEDGPRVLFEVSGDTCRLVAGDLEPLLGVRLAPEDALEYAVAAWNQMRGLVPHPLPETPQQQVDFAFALASLLDATTSGGPAASFELLDSRAAVERVLDPVVDCARSARFRLAQRAHVDRNFDQPTTEDRLETTRVTFAAWLSLDGEVFDYDVTLEPGARVRIARKSVAQHLGDHDER